MSTAVISAKGQLVIPAEIRRITGWKSGDRVSVTVAKDASVVEIKKKETPAEMSARLSKLRKPGIPPLIDVHQFFDTREPRI